MRSVHLDAIGGIAGDLFLSAMLSALPDARTKLMQDLADAGVADHVSLRFDDVREHGFAAMRVSVTTAGDAPATHHWRDIRQMIDQSALQQGVKDAAIGIFSELARAEATCHGIALEAVHFHEIADWDSLADIIGAASVIASAGASRWTVGQLPLGRGAVKTRHGRVPVPAPATAELLRGFSFVDDGGEGERITPTGAAILKWLAPQQTAIGPRGTLTAIGMGAGHMQIDGIPNILRALVFDDQTASGELVQIVRFDIDDMTPEELAVSLNHIRDHEGVLDAHHTVGIGKKGRAVFSVAVMAQPAATDGIVEQCFRETSTIGLRVETVARHVLDRRADTSDGLAIKTVTRPNGQTIKSESDALAGIKTLKARRKLASSVEATDD